MRINFNPIAQVSSRYNFNFGLNPIKLNNNLNFRGSSISDTFEPSKKPDEIKGNQVKTLPVPGSLESFQAQKTKFTVSDYDEFSNEIIKSQVKALADSVTFDVANRSTHIAVKFKKILDRTYGKDNYVFVSVGTKPSLIGKAFEFLGVETKYLPVSKRKKWGKVLKEQDYRLYGDFLKSQGLDANNVKNSSKTYLFYDYTNGDGRFENFEEMMRTRYGLTQENVKFRSLNRDLREIKNGTDLVEGYIKKYLVTLGITDKYSSIGYLPDYNFTKPDFASEKLTRHDDMDAKLFNFLVLDKLSTIRLLEENPDNEDAL